MKKRIQINFDVQEEVRRFIKANAAMRGITMNLWIHRAIQKEIDRIKQYE